MKRNEKKGFVAGAASLVLCLLMLLQLPVAAADAALNYGRGSGDRTLTASQLFDALFEGTEEVDLTNGERAALDALAEVSMTYAGVPESVIEREYDGDTGVLTIRVSTYSYTAQNGKTVAWIPQSISFNGGAPTQLTSMGDGFYICSFSGLNQSMKFTLDVDFLWQVEIEAEIANKLLTMPYSIGKNAWEALEPYETYQMAQQAYERYVAAKKQYDADKNAYDAYVVKKEAYDLKKSAYDAYLTAKTAYEAAVVAYQANETKKKAYQTAEKAYFEYQAFRQQHAALYDEYEVYLETAEKMNADLKVLESAYIFLNENAWSFFFSLGGEDPNGVSSATQFLSILDDKQAVTGIPKALIDEARASSQTLKNLLIEYNKLQNASYPNAFEKTRTKYEFYSQNYDSLCNSIKTFYEDMRAIYCTSGIPGLVEGVGKTQRIHAMIAQLYMLHCGLNDSETLNPDWTLNYAKTQKKLSEILDERLYVVDNDNASPKGLVIPMEEVKLPDSSFMQPVEKPVKDYDENLMDPTLQGAPAPVANPGAAPAVVSNPGNAPTEVQKPEGTCPAKPIQTVVENTLAKEYQQGILPEREARTAPQTLSLHHHVVCTREISNRKTVTFYDTDGVTVLYETTVEFGERLSNVTFPSGEKLPDERYSKYEFLGWIFSGDVADASNHIKPTEVRVYNDLSICAHYRTTDRVYKITWVLGNKQVDTYYRYGVIPAYSGSTAHPDADKAKLYTFRGWSPMVEAVTGDATYVAEYDRPAYTVTWIIGDVRHETTVFHGDKPVPVSTDRATDDRIYRFNRWNADITKPITGDKTFRAIYDEIFLGSYENNTQTPVPADHTAEALILRPTESQIWIVEAIRYVIEQDLDLSVMWENATVTYTKSQLETLLNGNCVRLQLAVADMAEGGGKSIRVYFRDRQNDAINLSAEAQMTLTVPTQVGLVGMIYLVTSDVATPVEVTRYSDGRLVFTYDGYSELLYRPEYRVQFTDPTENSNLTALPGQIAPETAVDLNVNCEYGYEVTGAILVYANGKTEEIVGSQFIMPDAPVTVQLKVERIAYTFTFMVDGVVYDVLNVFFGDAVVLPTPPVKAADNEFIYTFGGWDGSIPKSAVHEERNPVYNAIFIKDSAGGTAAEEYRGSFLIRVIIIGVLFVAVVVGVILCIVYRKRIRAFLKGSARKASLQQPEAIDESEASEATEEPQDAENESTDD